MKTLRRIRFAAPILMGIGSAVCGIRAGVSVTDGNDEGQSCFVITTDNAVYYYHKEGAGFSSILDKDENDWIGYRQGGGASGNFRGIPNMVHKSGPNGRDNYFHPGHSGGSGSTTTLESDDGSKAVLKSVSGNGAWEVVWEFYNTHAVMTVNKANGKYWFLYEGTPGGTFNKDNDYWMISDGTKKTCANRYDGDIPSPEWICFGDNTLNRVLVLAHANDDNDPDKFYQMDKSMTVFGFGRSGLTKYLTGTGEKLTIGFVESTDHGTIDDAVQAFVDGATSIRADGVSGFSVSTHWSGKNQNLYGGFGDIVRHDIAGSAVSGHKVLYNGEARFPTINQEGTKVAFIRNDGKVCVVSSQGGSVTELADGGKYGYLDWPTGPYIYYSTSGYPDSDGSHEIRKVNVGDRNDNSSVVTFNTQMWLWSMDASGSKIAVRNKDNDLCGGTGRVIHYTLPGNGNVSCSDGYQTCGNALSPTGTYVVSFTVGNYSHDAFDIRKWDKSIYKTFSADDFNSWGKNMGDSKPFNRTRWSANSDNWICTMQGNSRGSNGSNQVLYDWVNHKQLVTTSNSAGSNVFDDAGDFWIGESSIPDPDPPEFSSISIAPSSATVSPGGSVAFNAAAKDQYGNALSPQPSFDWEASGGGTMSGGTFTATAGSGSFTITVSATALGTERTATATVIIADAVFADDFSDGNLDGWNAADGSWEVQSGAAVNTAQSSDGNSYCYTDAFSYTDITYTVDVTPQEGSNQWVIFRVQENEDFYLFQFSDAGLYKKVGSSYSRITTGSGSVSGADTYTIEVVLEGESIRITSNGADVLQTTDNTFSRGAVGIGGYQSRAAFDNVSITGAGASPTKQYLTVTSPNGGGTYHIGDELTITWESDSRVQGALIEISLDMGGTWTRISGEDAIVPSDTDQWEHFTWTIPSEGIDVGGQKVSCASGQCLIRIEDPYGYQDSDVSDNVFTISDRASGGNGLTPVRAPGITVRRVNATMMSVDINDEGYYGLELLTADGGIVERRRTYGRGKYEIALPERSASVYILRIISGPARKVHRFVVY